MRAPLPSRVPGVVLHGLPDGTHALTRGAEGELLVINEVGAAIWLLLGSCDTLEALVGHVVDTLGAAPETARTDVLAFLEDLHRRGFVA